ncbi:DUF3179 domain-containing protein [Roseibacterium sp. SDUM158017]|uniref:DUF3179 domain-containing protein n=1 Tax=Roseicyclus salinarum TaxID=3036773 RepID=UPI002414DAD1|nr:DUF3179 domain-containing protein [Roseibacterium sp. SDUM158017]MDG4647592.1 DUF3179 domain-containing protein [Roseibacterium sp. SDUM158017]
MPRRLAATFPLAFVLLLAGQAPAQSPPAFAQWPDTDFASATVDLSEIVSGGVGRDGIPAIDDPDFVPAAEEDALEPREPVMTLALDGVPARAYPLRYLTWHEIVNDEVAGIPVAVTFCPLCNTALVFDRRVAGEVLTFGVSGNLRHSDMIMFDRQTESWWQQAVGEGIVGHFAGARLEPLVSWVESWESFRRSHPGGLVMAEPDSARPYGRNPYVGYDSASAPFLYFGEMPPHGMDPVARVVRVGARAWPLARLAEAGEIREAGLTITWQAGAASALDAARIAEGRDVGQIRVRDGTGADVLHDVMFAFAFHAFWPEGTWMLGGQAAGCLDGCAADP